MRVWDLAPPRLCDSHLLGQHNEIHCILGVLRSDSDSGYSSHPEVLRWEGHKAALTKMHHRTAAEMIERGMNHDSPMRATSGSERLPDPITPPHDQEARLRDKGCECDLDRETPT